MNVAVIGWGSLIWDPRHLARRGKWRRDGPGLPIEFARVSNDGRLTLVIHPWSSEQQAYWSPSAMETVEAARDDLRNRENTPNLENIGWTSRTKDHEVMGDTEARVRAWLGAHTNLDAAIWTDLRATLTGDDITAQAVAYLGSLPSGTESYERARQYVVSAPPQIQTAVRREMRARGWMDAELSSDLFEP